MDLRSIRKESESLLAALEEATWRARTARSPLELAPAFRAHPEVATPEAFALVREAAAASTGRRARRLEMLSEFLAGAVEATVARAADEARAGEQETATVRDPAGGELPLHEAMFRVASERDRGRRSALERAVADALSRADGPIVDRLETAQTTSAKLGFGGFLEEWTALSDIDLPALEAECERFLVETEAMYFDVLAWWLRRTTGLRPFPHGAERHDVLFALRAAEFDGLFRRDELARATQFLPRLALDPRARGRIRIDDRARPHRPFVARMDVPHETVLAHRAVGGADDLRSFLHQLGQAIRIAGIEAERPFEDRWLGDDSIGEGIGFLFDHLLCDARWLKRFLRAEASDLVRVLALGELHRARREVTTLLHQTELYRRGPVSEVRAAFAERLGGATGGAWPDALWLAEFEPRLQVARTVRGLALEAALFESMRERFDEDWWINPAAGAFLKALFAQGGFEQAETICRRLELGELSLGRVARRMEALLG